MSAVGLTNYFNFTDRDFVIKDKLSQAGIATFLNLEIRLDHLNHENQNFDFHIIISWMILWLKIFGEVLMLISGVQGNEQTH